MREIDEEKDEKKDDTKNEKMPASKPDKKTDKNGVREPNVIVAKFNEFKAEFKKIVWPDREELLKKTTTVIVISLIFGAYISLLDGVFGVLFSMFVDFIA